MRSADHIAASDALSAIVGRGALAESMLKVSGLYKIQHHRLIGSIRELIHEEEAPNLITTVGRNLLLDTTLAGSAYTAAFYMGLKGTGSPAAGDTMASHAGWSELTSSYSEATRRTCVWSSAASGSKALSAGLVFTANTTVSVFGIFCVGGSGAVNTKGDTNGVLFNAVNFAAQRDLLNLDTLTVTYTATLT